MISELEISGFKALTKVRLEGLRRLTLIGGRNNTGKTSVLEAYFLSLDWGNPEMLLHHMRWRGIDAIATNPEAAWAPAFTDFKLSGRIQVKSKAAQGDRLTYVAQIVEDTQRGTVSKGSQDAKENIRSPEQSALRVTYSRGSKTVFDAQIVARKAVPPYELKTTVSLEKAARAQYTRSRHLGSATNDAMYFGQLDLEKKTDEIVKSLQVLEPRLRGLSVIPVGPSNQIFADIDGLDKKIPINLLGDGITRLLSLLLHISNVQSGYILVDEIENGFHYSVMAKVWEIIYLACKTQKCQLIATTHSYECLTAFANSLKDVAEDNYSYCRLDRREKEIECTPYDAKSLRDATAGGWEVR